MANVQQLTKPTPTDMQTNKPTSTIVQQQLMNNPLNPSLTTTKQTQPDFHQQQQQLMNTNLNPVHNLGAKTETQQLVHGNLNTVQTPSNIRQQLTRDDMPMFSSADDNMMLKHIQGTHTPDGREIVEVKPLLQLIEDIISRANPRFAAIGVSGTPGHAEVLEERTYSPNFIAMLDSVGYLIDRISSEIGYKSAGGGDVHSTTMAILNLVSYYSWDTKLVLALAAFAVQYGEFWLIGQTYTSNHLAKSVAMLRQLPEVLQNSSMFKPRFEAIMNLINAMLDIAKCIVAFKELPSQYVKPDHPALSTAMVHIPMAVYWAIRSIVACADQITGLSVLGQEHIISTQEAWELSSSAHKLSNMHKHLINQLEICYKDIDERKFDEGYNHLKRSFQTTHIDNLRVLWLLISSKEDQPPLVDGVTKRRVNLDVLKRKNVLLLISDLDISQEELSILEQIYNESRHHSTRQESQYEVVWLPILDPAVPFTEARKRQFENLQSGMPWYTVHHPSLIDRAVIKFIKEVWSFKKKPILVVLDPQGRVASPNALHMMWIWGSRAFPFTTIREEALWNEETWRLDLLVEGIDPVILNWMNEGRYICLYGGEDMEWIRRFTGSARAVAQSAGIPLEMVYVGRSNPKDRVRRNISTILVDKLSYCWSDLTLIWYFWVRIESMWHSKNQLGKTPDNDTIMREIISLLTFDSSEGGWAIFSRGSGGGHDITKAKGPQFHTCLIDYNIWKVDVQEKGFIPAMHDYLAKIHPGHHCNRLVLPGTAGMIPENIACSECGRIMDRFIMYQCCDD
ncbi:protein SIEVE ELEMENT OCCLUSION B-like [Tripterygium wilfordii]|uniref:protein SIEVE ELEMENT OCCLUSION B-like n=1 Tax=Tripterygium wilfordii TaxID=458696 RepID=UPI0018F8162A|nr:protein SIEVE ELEMENT OCCLUSION B-like [Tripterygium wilfordii]